MAKTQAFSDLINVHDRHNIIKTFYKIIFVYVNNDFFIEYVGLRATQYITFISGLIHIKKKALIS